MEFDFTFTVKCLSFFFVSCFLLFSPKKQIELMQKQTTQCIMLQVSEGKHKLRNKFSKTEDDLLRSLVEQYGENSWPEVAKNMVGRNTRQCRDRWTQYLSPAANNSSWSKEEDNQLIKLYNEFGSKWALISKYFNGRTNSCVRNRAVFLIRNIDKSKSEHKNPVKDVISIKKHKEDMSSPSTSPENSRPPEPEMPQTQFNIIQIPPSAPPLLLPQIPPKTLALNHHVLEPVHCQKPHIDHTPKKNPIIIPPPFVISTFVTPILPVSNFSNYEFETSIYQ